MLQQSRHDDSSVERKHRDRNSSYAGCVQECGVSSGHNRYGPHRPRMRTHHALIGTDFALLHNFFCAYISIGWDLNGEMIVFAGQLCT